MKRIRITVDIDSGSTGVRPAGIRPAGVRPAGVRPAGVRPVVSLIKVCLLQFLTQLGNLGENIALPVDKLILEYDMSKKQLQILYSKESRKKNRSFFSGPATQRGGGKDLAT